MNEGVDRRVHELMEQLDSLIDGESAAAHLVACGQVAVEPLRRFVLESPPRGVPQPRCWAVQALAGLGAKDILIEYLQREIPSTDPVVRLAEEAVQRAAALALAAEWHTDDVFDILLTLTARRPIPGIIEALGRFERRDAVPLLVHALGDDFCRPWAETALERVASRDRDLLIRWALMRTSPEQAETEASLRRRRSLLRLLRDVSLSSDEAHLIASLIDAADLELAVDAAAIAIKYAPEDDAHRARARLSLIAPTAPWHLHDDVQQLLHGAAAQRAVTDPRHP
jgi:hypothetical protein